MLRQADSSSTHSQSKSSTDISQKTTMVSVNTKETGSILSREQLYQCNIDRASLSSKHPIVNRKWIEYAFSDEEVKIETSRDSVTLRYSQSGTEEFRHICDNAGGAFVGEDQSYTLLCEDYPEKHVTFVDFHVCDPPSCERLRYDRSIKSQVWLWCGRLMAVENDIDSNSKEHAQQKILLVTAFVILIFLSILLITSIYKNAKYSQLEDRRKETRKLIVGPQDEMNVEVYGALKQNCEEHTQNLG